MSSPFLRPLPEARWNRAAARHLLNRAGFGVPHSAIERLAAMTQAQAVDLMVDYDRFPDNLEEPDFISPPVDREDLRMAVMASEEDRQRQIQELLREARAQTSALKGWWLGQMRTTNRPLQEKLTLFWHSHFAVSAEKVKQPSYNYELNKVFRQNAAGNFRELVFLVGATPAMLTYLDNRQNRKGAPNENWARELMELFTIGPGHYTEQDIKEAARAFSGYGIREHEFRFDARQHDYDAKTFMGQTGNFDGRDVIDIIFQQPASAHHITRKLWEYFVYDDPDPALVDAYAGVLRENDFELKPLLKAIFLSEEFHSPRAMNAQVKSPAQFLVMLMEHLALAQPRGLAIDMALRALGQDLFYPPNVKGWDGNRAWITTSSLLMRYNIPGYAVTGQRPDFGGRERRLDEQGMPMMQEEDAPMAAVPMQPVMQQQQMSENRREAMRERAQERVKQLRENSAAARQRTQAEKQGLRRGRGLTPEVTTLLSTLRGKPAATAVRELEDRFLSCPLDASQRAVLVQTLTGSAGGDAAMLTEDLLRTRGPGVLQLITSAAEYQVC